MTPFKSSSQERRKVSFQDGPPEEIDNIYDASEPSRRSAAAGKSSKWQPLSTVAPSPVGENDPFSLGDSEDEKDTKPKEAQAKETPAQEAPADEAERVKKATADAMAEELGSGSKDEDKKAGEK